MKLVNQNEEAVIFKFQRLLIMSNTFLYTSKRVIVTQLIPVMKKQHHIKWILSN